jgi:hypothetical protein
MRVAGKASYSARAAKTKTEMRKPSTRASLPPRNSDNMKRKIDTSILVAEVRARYGTVSYEGSSKHKLNPHIFGLEPFRGRRGDRTLCDKHALFSPADMRRVPTLLERALRARLVGSHIWTVDDNGWIYELTVTNPTTNEHHGYPLRPFEAFAEIVYRHFQGWVLVHGSHADQAAALACRERYGFRS